MALLMEFVIFESLELKKFVSSAFVPLLGFVLTLDGNLDGFYSNNLVDTVLTNVFPLFIIKIIMT